MYKKKHFHRLHLRRGNANGTVENTNQRGLRGELLSTKRRGSRGRSREAGTLPLGALRHAARPRAAAAAHRHPARCPGRRPFALGGAAGRSGRRGSIRPSRRPGTALTAAHKGESCASHRPALQPWLAGSRRLPPAAAHLTLGQAAIAPLA